jgi:hypothetical protein
VLDRERGGIDLLDRVGGNGGGPAGAQLLERAPQPAGAAVDLRLVRQVREQAGPVAADFVQEAVLAAAAEQVPDQGDGQQLGVGAGRSRARPARNR